MLHPAFLLMVTEILKMKQMLQQVLTQVTPQDHITIRVHILLLLRLVDKTLWVSFLQAQLLKHHLQYQHQQVLILQKKKEIEFVQVNLYWIKEIQLLKKQIDYVNQEDQKKLDVCSLIEALYLLMQQGLDQMTLLRLILYCKVIEDLDLLIFKQLHLMMLLVLKLLQLIKLKKPLVPCLEIKEQTEPLESLLLVQVALAHKYLRLLFLNLQQIQEFHIHLVLLLQEQTKEILYNLIHVLEQWKQMLDVTQPQNKEH